MSIVSKFHSGGSEVQQYDRTLVSKAETLKSGFAVQFQVVFHYIIGTLRMGYVQKLFPPPDLFLMSC